MKLNYQIKYYLTRDEVQELMVEFLKDQFEFHANEVWHKDIYSFYPSWNDKTTDEKVYFDVLKAIMVILAFYNEENKSKAFFKKTIRKLEKKIGAKHERKTNSRN